LGDSGCKISKKGFSWLQCEEGFGIIVELEGLLAKRIHRCYVSLQEINRMSKPRDTRKEKKKPPQKTAEEKRQAKREKKNR
jgi:hypothetical protein